MDYRNRSNSNGGSNGSAPTHSIGAGWSLTIPKTEWKVSSPPDIHSPPSNLMSCSRNGNFTFNANDSNLVKIVMLGSPGVGKTSIIQQFVWGTFESAYYPTDHKETYYPSVILNDDHYELKIVDIPDLPLFSVNSIYNLSDLESYGLVDVTVYVFVFDLFCSESFEYVSHLFTQISEARDYESVPVVVIGNKADKVELSLRSWKRKKPSDDWGEEDYGSENLSSPQDYSASVGLRNYQGYFSYSEEKSAGSSSYKHRSFNDWGSEAFFEKEIADKVSSEWRALYRECAAVDAESVSELFKEVMELVVQNQSLNGGGSKVDKNCILL